MDSENQKRTGRRFPCRVQVAWSYFNQPESHSAKMLNFSQEGVALEADQPLIRGASVVMRLEDDAGGCRPDCGEAAECPWVRSTWLGHVRWCGPGAEEGISASGWRAGVRMYPL